MNPLVAPAARAAREAAARVAAPPLHERFRLRNGEQVLIRPVRPSDADAEQVFVRSLSPTSRLLRFHLGIRELAPETLRAFTNVDERRHVAVVAQQGGPGGRIVADARYVRDDGDDTSAEFAIAVADEWQGRGLGRHLMRRLLDHAAAHGVRRMWGHVLYENPRMLAMVREAGGRFVHAGDATLTRAVFDL